MLIESKKDNAESMLFSSVLTLAHRCLKILILSDIGTMAQNSAASSMLQRMLVETASQSPATAANRPPTPRFGGLLRAVDEALTVLEQGHGPPTAIGSLTGSSSRDLAQVGSQFETPTTPHRTRQQ